MARPKITDSRILNKHLPAVRCTEEEIQAIKKKSDLAGLTVSEFIRKSALESKVQARKQSKIEENFELVNQLKKVGNNVNQIAKNMHIFRNPPSADHKRVWEKLEQVLDQIVTTI